MKFISKRYVIKIPSETVFLYYEKKKKMLILYESRKIVLNLHVKLKFLKRNNYVVVTNSILKIQNKLKNDKKLLQGATFFLLKKLIRNIKMNACNKLKLFGIGYKVLLINDKTTKYRLLQFKLGYSHNIYFKIPKTIKIEVRQSNKIFLLGANHNLLYKISSIIKSYKYPDSYKGKGILYFNEQIRLKEGKKI